MRSIARNTPIGVGSLVAGSIAAARDVVGYYREDAHEASRALEARNAEAAVESETAHTAEYAAVRALAFVAIGLYPVGLLVLNLGLVASCRHAPDCETTNRGSVL